eukprot:TRINITY_DN1162_c0_g2_i9.p1 TRINITY_DN1162_c0_g2~~TRINITY_DN1162_c0_g2_i9.p1  ORF type:complete len:562 (+),score=207.06 TRINITY_DN1162_c0_g2_i9:44-1729(+)
MTEKSYVADTLVPGYGAADNSRNSVSNLSARSEVEPIIPNTRESRRSLNPLRNSMNPRGSRAVSPLRASRKSWAGNVATRMSMTMPNGVPHEAQEADTLFQIARREVHLFVGMGSSIFFLIWGDHDTLDSLDDGLFAVMFTWIFLTILWHAFAVVRHADCLAVKLGEPYGTLILTVSVISIEVIMMVALMLTGNNATYARDTMFSVVMIVLNGMLGVTLIMGGWRHSEQEYNLKSSQAFLNVITPLSVLSLIIPNYTKSSTGTVSDFHAGLLIVTSIFLYGTFLLVQTMYHPEFFMYSNKFGIGEGSTLGYDDDAYSDFENFDLEAGNGTGGGENGIIEEVKKLKNDQGKLAQSVSNLHKQLCTAAGSSPYSGPMSNPRASIEPFEESDDEHAGLVLRSTKYHTLMLFLSMVPVSLLAEKLTILVEHLIKSTGAPHAFAGFLIAVLVLSPEAMGAAKAALANKIQRTVNIALGSALSTIGLTVPSVLTVMLITDKELVLGLQDLSIVVLVLTLIVCQTTFGGGKTGLLQGAVHMVLFVSYVALLFEMPDETSASATTVTQV